jgi:hypothetical protein
VSKGLVEKLGEDNPISHELTFMMALMEYEELVGKGGEADPARKQQLAEEMQVGAAPFLSCFPRAPAWSFTLCSERLGRSLRLEYAPSQPASNRWRQGLRCARAMSALVSLCFQAWD